MMEKQMMFHILGIEETKDEEAIKTAYRALLKQTNPEDDPEGFKRLRGAYEEACIWARQTEEVSHEEKSEIELWIQRVNQVYVDIERRRDPECWKEVLDDPVNDGLDTSLDAREILIAYLTSHIYLPQAVWEKVDKKFQILEDIENLKQTFPGNFLDYISYYIQNKEFINYQLFQVRKQDCVDVDGYINHYMTAKRKIDANDLEGIMEELCDLQAFGIYHPYEDAERIRVMISEDSPESDPAGAEALADRLLAEYPDEGYVLLYGAEAKWAAGRKADACDIWNRILEQDPSHYMAKSGVVRYLMDQKEYGRAKELMMDLLDVEGHDEIILEFLETANKVLIEEYKEKLAKQTKGEPGWKADAMELGWCLFQNDGLEEAVELLEGFKPEPDQEYSYMNLLGRILYRKEEYGKALPYLKRWLELIRGLSDDGTAENKKRISRLSRALHILGGCCFELGETEEAEGYLQQAVGAARVGYDRIACLQYLGYIHLKQKHYEKTVDICDQIIEEDSGYYPAYLQRQEAYFELKKGQQVVDDYHRAVGIYPGFYKPYLLAVQVFFYCDQYEDARGVLELARENQVEFTSRMKLFEIKLLRNLATKEEQREQALNLCQELLKEINGQETDIEDKSEVEFEIALLYWDNRKYEEALAHLRDAIGQNRERRQYQMVKGHILREMEWYDEALKEYQKAKDAYGKTPGYYYNMALCYEARGGVILARENLEQAVELEDGYEDCYEKLADIYWDAYKEKGRRADYEKAVEYISRQIALTENCYYLVHRGLIHMEAMEMELAIQDYKKAVEHSPDDWAAYNNMGYSYKSLGEYETSLAMYERSIRCFTERRNLLPYSNMADIYEIQKKYEKAVECYRKDLEWFPDRTSFWKEIGMLYSYLGRYEEALEAFGHIKGTGEYYSCVGDVYERKGEIKKALWLYKKAIWLEMDDKAERWYELGDVYMERRLDYKKAASCYRRAIRLETSHKELFRYETDLAAAYYGMEQFEEAELHARRAMAEFRQAGYGTEENYVNYRAYGPTRLGRMGRLYLYLGETKKGLGYLEQMGTGYRCKNCRFPGCYESHLHIGKYFESSGHLELALQEYEKAESYNEHSLAVACALQNLRKVMERKQ